MIDYLLPYEIIINVVSLLLISIDKRKAIKRNHRISEITFFTLSLLGGFIGIYLGMILVRHKTQKLSFQLKVIVGELLHIIVLYLFYTSH